MELEIKVGIRIVANMNSDSMEAAVKKLLSLLPNELPAVLGGLDSGEYVQVVFDKEEIKTG